MNMFQNDMGFLDMTWNKMVALTRDYNIIFQPTLFIPYLKIPCHFETEVMTAKPKKYVWYTSKV